MVKSIVWPGASVACGADADYKQLQFLLELMHIFAIRHPYMLITVKFKSQWEIGNAEKHTNNVQAQVEQPWLHAYMNSHYSLLGLIT